MELNTERLSNGISHHKDFWHFIDRLVADHTIVVDRPKGSHHPRFPDLIYPLDYGYLDGTTTMDGGGIDVWIGSQGIHPPDAIVLSIDLKKNDLEIKLILGCNREEIRTIVDFLNDHSMRAMLIKRERDELGLLRNRRSVRRFSGRPIPNDLIYKILEAATWAPSSHNRQPWRIAVLTSQEVKTNLAQAMSKDFQTDLARDGLDQDEIQAQVKRSRDRISQAPVCLVLCLDPTLGDHYPDPERNQAEHLMGVQSVAMAGQNLMLAASRLGLGSVWMCAPLFTSDTVQKTLGLPSTWLPQGMILLGYPAKEPVYKPRLPVDEIALFL
jgi:coenzyme F420-0:L-glutamate ligase/coenzyme F420-1:gamma-L-glutamate ligase